MIPSLKFLAGVAVGYGVVRAVEAHAQQVPFDLAFKHLLTPIGRLKQGLCQCQEQASGAPVKQRGSIALLPAAPASGATPDLAELYANASADDETN